MPLPRISPLVFLLLIQIIYSCSSIEEPKPSSEKFHSKFVHITAPDTLAIRFDKVNLDTGRSISPQLFMDVVDTLLIQKMLYEPDTFDFRGKAYWKIQLDKEYEGCLIGIEQVWFKFKYLLIYSKKDKNYIDLVPVAYFYGGEGGQVSSESWIFDFGTNPVLLTRYLEHYLRLSESNLDAPEEMNLQKVGIQKWSTGQFLEDSLQDSLRWIKNYPILVE